jgi:endo-1,4-beta-D-glucanase Y
MNRRNFIGMAGVGCALGVAGVAGATSYALAAPPHTIAGLVPKGHALRQAWAGWKALCLMPDGRVVDGPQADASHSEGQGYGLTLAAIFDDMPAFERIWAWTEANLAVRDDALLAWRWQVGVADPVPDTNNASDGDLFYIWALSAVAVRHNRKDLAKRARAMAKDLAAACIVPHPGRAGAKLFLPGAFGFTTDAGVLINPSYYMTRAMVDIAAATGVRAFDRLARDGVALMADLAATGLVPDWIEVTAQGFAPPPQRFSANAGYESIRVPLFALWSGDGAGHAVARYANAVASNDPAQPATLFQRQSGAVLERSAHPGYQAVAALVSCAASLTTVQATPTPVMPQFTTDQPYYPATLHIMALIAQTEGYPQCVPV